MSSVRYKKLLSNLPSMASIVNSFQSPEVQLVVFQTLMDELNGSLLESSSNGSRETKLHLRKSSSTILTTDEVVHDLVEGDSIHAMEADGDSLN